MARTGLSHFAADISAIKVWIGFKLALFVSNTTVKLMVERKRGVDNDVQGQQERKKNLERFTNLRVILAQGPC